MLINCDFVELKCVDQLRDYVELQFLIYIYKYGSCLIFYIPLIVSEQGSAIIELGMILVHRDDTIIVGSTQDQLVTVLMLLMAHSKQTL